MPQSIVVGQVRQTVPLAVDANQQLQKKNVQYSTGFTLAPGKYHVKFVVRENQSGNMGSFETDIQVPDMKKTPLKLSSIVMSSQRQPNAAKKVVDPLMRDGQEWVPNVPARVPAGPAPLLPVRGLQPDARQGRPGARGFARPQRGERAAPSTC